MPHGVASITSTNLPESPFVVDPVAFMQGTKKNVKTMKTFSMPDPGRFFSYELPRMGILGKIFLTFEGEMVVDTGGATAGINYPHGLLKDMKISINGQNDAWSVDGVDLKVLRFCRNPSYSDSTDVYPGTLGGSATPISAGTYDVYLTFEIPIALDETSLVGSVYMQSNSNNVTLTATMATMPELFSANDDKVTFSGNWSVTEVFFEIPFDKEGKLVVPDLSSYHGFNAVNTSFANVGDVKTFLTKSSGQLERLFVSVTKSTTARLSAAPNAAAANKIDALRVEYGGNQVPYSFLPASLLQSINNVWYGDPPPYDRLIIDNLRENPLRDTMFEPGLTELCVVPVVNSTVSVATGAQVRVVKETLFN